MEWLEHWQSLLERLEVRQEERESMTEQGLELKERLSMQTLRVLLLAEDNVRL